MPNLEEHISAFNDYLSSVRTMLSEALTARNIEIKTEQGTNRKKDKISELLSCFLSFDPIPVGTIIASYARTAPTGYLPCDGREVTTAAYPKLAAVMNVTSNAFKVPNLQGKFIQGCTGTETPGEIKDAGLPDITGTLLVDDSMYSKPGNYYTGAFTQGDPFGKWDLHSYSGGYASGWINFNASSSNRIYGKSDTVQPPAICLKYYIKC